MRRTETMEHICKTTDPAQLADELRALKQEKARDGWNLVNVGWEMCFTEECTPIESSAAYVAFFERTLKIAEPAKPGGV